MRLQNLTPHPLLRNYIQKLWVFESNGKMHSDDMKLIVPNGLIKMVVPIRNGVIGKIDNFQLLSKENRIILIGIADQPAIVDIESDTASGSIGIEFSSEGSYRFFSLKFGDIKNQIFSLTDVLGKIVKELEDRIASECLIEKKVAIVQQFLIKQFHQNSDPVFDYCVQRIKASHGRASVNQLEKETGFSSRWINQKFIDRLGTSPKNLSSIIRFQQYYQSIMINKELEFYKNDFYNYYYDQSHFIREFKRFTGLSPKKFENAVNSFGEIFYKG